MKDRNKKMHIENGNMDISESVGFTYQHIPQKFCNRRLKGIWREYQATFFPTPSGEYICGRSGTPSSMYAMRM